MFEADLRSYLVSQIAAETAALTDKEPVIAVAAEARIEAYQAVLAWLDAYFRLIPFVYTDTGVPQAAIIWDLPTASLTITRGDQVSVTTFHPNWQHSDKGNE